MLNRLQSTFRRIVLGVTTGIGILAVNRVIASLPLSSREILIILTLPVGCFALGFLVEYVIRGLIIVSVEISSRGESESQSDGHLPPGDRKR